MGVIEGKGALENKVAFDRKNHVEQKGDIKLTGAVDSKRNKMMTLCMRPAEETFRNVKSVFYTRLPSSLNAC